MFIGGATLSNSANVRGGSQTGLQAFTGYGEWDADAKLTLQPAARQTLTLTGQRVSASQVERTDLLRAGTDLKNEWDPQRRQLLAADYEARQVAAFIDSIGVQGWFSGRTKAIGGSPRRVRPPSGSITTAWIPSASACSSTLSGGAPG